MLVLYSVVETESKNMLQARKINSEIWLRILAVIFLHDFH